MTRVALLQIDVSSARSPEQRTQDVLSLIRAQAGRCEVVCLPELWTVGAFSNNLMAESATERDSAFISTLGQAARDAKVWLHAGSFVERDGKNLFNTSVVFRPDGSIASFYRKIHLFGFDDGEATLMSGGTDLVTLDETPLGTVGLTTCYDLRFPELFRALVNQDVETFIVASGWPESRLHHWEILLQARAIENQAWVIACNATGSTGDVKLAGNSMVVNPQGQIVDRAGVDQTVLYADVSMEAVSQWRTSFPALADQVLD
jgi:predicted amidohydrolase